MKSLNIKVLNSYVLEILRTFEKMNLISIDKPEDERHKSANEWIEEVESGMKASDITEDEIIQVVREVREEYGHKKP